MVLYEDMKGQIALITGGGQGIGKACVETLARHGAFVIATGRRIAMTQAVIDAIKAEGHDGVAMVVDVAQPSSISALMAQITRDFGKVDILVNNAGMVDRHGIDELTLEEWDQVIDTNLRGTHLLCQACIPLMRARGHGKIVNVSSIAGRIGGKRTAPNYNASKGGVIAMTRSYAMHCAQDHININAVAPGLIETPMTQGRNKGSDVPMGRLGTAQDIADAVYFLASKYSDYITGCTIDVNGGLYMN